LFLTEREKYMKLRKKRGRTYEKENAVMPHGGPAAVFMRGGNKPCAGGRKCDKPGGGTG
jgi:hypothetical protein